MSCGTHGFPDRGYLPRVDSVNQCMDELPGALHWDLAQHGLLVACITQDLKMLQLWLRGQTIRAFE